MRISESFAIGATLLFVLRTTRPLRRETRAPSRVPFNTQPNGFLINRAPTQAVGLAAAQEHNDWLVWQLIDSAFPTGGFAHSSGLEAAWQHGEVRNRDELILFLDASLEQLGHAALPFVTAAFDSPEKLAKFDSLCDAFMTNHVANRASRAQGRAFLSAVERVFNFGRSQGNEAQTKKPNSQSLLTSAATKKHEPPLFAHFAPIFGACLRRLEVPRATALRMFFFNHLRGVFAAAVRLNIIGPMEAQRLQHKSSPKAEMILKKCETLSLDEIAQTAPLLDLWQGAQDRLYSRLFQS